jgi:hypothetical protein
VFGHVIKVFRDGLFEYLSYGLDVASCLVVPKKVLCFSPGYVYVGVAVLELVEELGSDGFLGLGHILSFERELKLRIRVFGGEVHVGEGKES